MPDSHELVECWVTVITWASFTRQGGLNLGQPFTLHHLMVYSTVNVKGKSKVTYSVMLTTCDQHMWWTERYSCCKVAWLWYDSPDLVIVCSFVLRSVCVSLNRRRQPVVLLYLSTARLSIFWDLECIVVGINLYPTCKGDLWWWQLLEQSYRRSVDSSTMTVYLHCPFPFLAACETHHVSPSSLHSHLWILQVSTKTWSRSLHKDVFVDSLVQHCCP